MLQRRSAVSKASVLPEIAQDQAILHKAAYRAHVPLPQGGLLKYVEGGEYHCFNPDVVNTSSVASLIDKNFATYKKFAELVDNRPVATLRDFNRYYGAQASIDIANVVEGDSAAMSIGALSPSS